MVTHPRLIGAGLGALVGILFVAAGAVLSNVADFFGNADMSMNLEPFAAFGLAVVVVGLPAGARFGPWALRERRWMVGASILFAILVAAGILAGLLVYAIGNGFDLSGSSDSIIATVPWFLGLGVAAAVAWIALLRAIGKGPRQSILSLMLAAELLGATILVECLLTQ